MKLRNKWTGEIGKLHCDMNVNPAKYGVFEDTDIRGHYWEYNSLAELNAEWEDVPTEEVWYLGERIGNYSMPKKEARKATEKILAWKWLKDKGFEFNSVEMFGSGFIRIEASIPINKKTTLQERSDITDSLYLLFGGEE